MSLIDGGDIGGFLRYDRATAALKGGLHPVAAGLYIRFGTIIFLISKSF